MMSSLVIMGVVVVVVAAATAVAACPNSGSFTADARLCCGGCSGATAVHNDEPVGVPRTAASSRSGEVEGGGEEGE